MRKYGKYIKYVMAQWNFIFFMHGSYESKSFWLRTMRFDSGILIKTEVLQLFDFWTSFFIDGIDRNAKTVTDLKTATNS